MRGGSVANPVPVCIQQRVIAVASMGVTGQAEADAVGYRAADKATENLVVEIAVAGVELAGQRFRRRQSVDQNRAARGVAAIQRTLRTLEYFDAFEIGEVGVDRRHIRLVEAIDIDTDIVFKADACGQRTDTAHGRIRERALEVDLQAGNRLAQILQIADAALFGGLRRDGRDGHRHVFKALGAVLRGDDDLVLICGSWICSPSNSRRNQCNRCAAMRKDIAMDRVFIHFRIPPN